MTRKRIKVAVVGAGFSNSPDGRERWAVRTHVPALKALPEIYDLTAVCTTKAASAEAARLAYGARLAFDDYNKMIASPEIDAVAVVVHLPREIR